MSSHATTAETTLPTASLAGTLREYYLLTKPGIIRGNLLTAIAGFFLASNGHIDTTLFVATLAGIALVIASGCVFNNYLDRHIDQKMARTRQRALVLGTISKTNALAYATVLGLLGFMTLIQYTNWLNVVLGLGALFSYVILYGIAKRRSVHGTLVGSLPGAASMVAGYTAISGHLDTTALLLFLIMVTWQMPHFYAIALYRRDDYANASLPVLPVKRGPAVAKRHILIYIAAFTAAAASLSLYGPAGPLYLIAALILGLSWLALGVKTYQNPDPARWGRAMFLYSLLVISGLCLAIIIDSIFG